MISIGMAKQGGFSSKIVGKICIVFPVKNASIWTGLHGESRLWILCFSLTNRKHFTVCLRGKY